MTARSDAPRLEGDILGDVLVAVTALPETFVWRANAGTFRSQDGKRYVQANVPGCADVIGTRRGRSVAIETKTAKGAQRESQRLFQRKWEASGGFYVIARSGPEAVAALLAAIP